MLLRFRILIFLVFQALLLYGLAMNSRVLPPTKSLQKEPFCAKWKMIDLGRKNWKVEYEGFGQINFNNGINLQPRSVASAAPEQTHSALALSNELYKNFALKIKYKNVSTLRKPASNSWEVFWLMFNYRSDQDHKKTNYFIFKPNGIELGKAYGKVDQQFLSTDEFPKSEIGKEYELSLFKQGQNVQVFINGKSALDFKGDSKNSLFDENGHIGLYTEDAQVQISKLELCEF
jgi:hypothetical protein